MRIFFCLLGIAWSASAETLQVTIQGLERTEFEYMYELNTDSDFEQVVLDCQSFIHGLNFYRLNHDNRLYRVHGLILEAHECEGMHDYLVQNDGKDLCLNIDLKAENMELKQGACPAP